MCPICSRYARTFLQIFGQIFQIQMFEQLPNCSGVTPGFYALRVCRPKHTRPSSLQNRCQPALTLSNANWIESSLSVSTPPHSCGSSLLQTVPAFANKNILRFCPCRRHLRGLLAVVSHPCASLAANQIKSLQDFPRYPRPTACANAAVLHVGPSLRLPTFVVSVLRDSKASHLPGPTLQRTTD